MSAGGFVLPAAVIGLGAIKLKPRQRGFFPPAGKPITAQVTIEEVAHDELEITEHPVEQGAMIADHAYKRPAEVVIRCAWSNSPSGASGLLGAAVGAGAALTSGRTGTIVGALAAVPSTFTAAQSMLNGSAADQCSAIYKQLLALQDARVLFDVWTGKRKYTDMLFKSISQSTDKDSENALLITAVCRQVLVARTAVVFLPLNPDALAVTPGFAPMTDFGTQNLSPGANFVTP